MSKPVSIIKNDGSAQPFEAEKLADSLRRAGAAQPAIEEITEEIGQELHEGMTTADIYGQAFSLLRKHHAPTATKYSIRRALLELGPDGFPFEKLIARIFAILGYETLTDQVLKGDCVEHEVDVIAWKGDSLAMVEAKFHNEFGLKSDLKVALYVKARYDDLADKEFTFGGGKRKITERWLATNTKFTDKAIAYGECSHLKMLGWNYPAKGNLHEIIEQNGFHPVTCLTTLTHQQKRDLVGRGALVCLDVVGQPALLDEIGVSGPAAERVLSEAQLIIEQAK